MNIIHQNTDFELKLNIRLSNFWELRRIKYITKISYGESLKEENRIDGSYTVFGSNGIVGSHDTSITDGETIIIGRKGSFGKLNWSPLPCFPIDTTFYIDKKNTSSNLRWLYYSLENLKLDSFTKDSSVPGINREEIYDRYIFYPSNQEQSQIVSFLDEKTSIIDDLIQKKLHKIDLLKEQRTSIINQIVTKGLNSNVKMKDSGVEWIGDIPEHWRLTRLKYFVLFDSGYSFNSSDYSAEGISLIRIGNLYNNILDLERSPVFVPERFLQDYPDFVVHKNDILVSLTGTLGKRDYGFSIVYDKEFPSLLNQRVGRIKLVSQELNFHLLTYLLLSEIFLNQLFVKPTGTKQGNLSADDILTNYLPIPPLPEQHQIVDYLDKKTSDIDKQVDLENRKINLLKEYRQSLISEVVTGKIDVRTN